MLPLNDQFEIPSLLHPFHHRNLDFPPSRRLPAILSPVAVLITTIARFAIPLAHARRDPRRFLKVRYPPSIPIVVELHDKPVPAGGDQDEEHERVREGGAVA
jgi:hypothetical protein